MCSCNTSRLFGRADVTAVSAPTLAQRSGESSFMRDASRNNSYGKCTFVFIIFRSLSFTVKWHRSCGQDYNIIWRLEHYLNRSRHQSKVYLSIYLTSKYKQNRSCKLLYKKTLLYIFELMALLVVIKKIYTKIPT